METLLSVLLVTFIVSTINAYAQQSEIQKLSGPYLGQKTPGTTAEKLAK